MSKKKHVQMEFPSETDTTGWLDFIKKMEVQSVIKITEKDQDLKKLRRTIRTLQKKNLIEADYAMGGKRGDRFLYLFVLKEEI